MYIAQITDLHISDQSNERVQLVDCTARLARVVEVLESLIPRPDVVLLTGDLTDEGTADQYLLLQGLLAPLTIPVLPIPGNHDLHDAFVESFAEVLPPDLADGHCSYVIEPRAAAQPRLIGFDTSHPERIDGVAPQDRLLWLDQQLSAAPEVPTLIFMHHPPIDSTIWWMDIVGLSPGDAVELRAVIARHDQIRLVVAGHIHRPIHSMIGSARVSICPSTVHQVGLSVVEEAVPSVSTEPAGFQLHVWTGEEFVTHTERVDDRAERVELDSFRVDVERYRSVRSETGALFKSDLGF
ncbi:MAG: phosphodiesterase [Acidobacteria bacterium]|nr:phosphodiesterase [Acidobacteriota bacterium]